MAETATFAPFSCHDAIYHLCKRSRVNKTFIVNESESFLHESFIDVWKHHHYVAFEIVKLCQVPLCIIGRINNSQRSQHVCLMDVRHLDIFKNQTSPLFWIIDMQTGVLLKETTKRFKIPTLSYHEKKYNQLAASLWDILQVPEDEDQEEPQSADDLKQVLQKHNLFEDTNVLYCISIQPQQEMPWVMGHTATPVAPLCFFAYTKSDLSIGYAFRQPEKLNHHSMPMFADNELDQDNQPIPDASSANKKTAVSVKMVGLLLAHKLGLCSDEELQHYSQALANCVGAIWVTCDNEKHIRHAVYKDVLITKAVEIRCQDENWNVKHWKVFFKTIQKSAVQMKQRKRNVLQEILNKLEPFKLAKARSMWSNCYTQLQSAINKHKVFVFCNDDTVLHQLKVPIAGAFKTFKSKGIYLQTLANYTITALSSPLVVFINLAEYFNYHGKMFQAFNDDDTLWTIAQDWLPPDGHDSNTSWAHPELKHNIKYLHNHPPVFATPPINYVMERSTRNASAILKLWLTLVTYSLVEFGYELASLPHTSLAKMAFDIIWLNYAKISGPFAHAIEQLHPYTVYMLRPWCKGGFSYSFENYLKMGMRPTPQKEPAKLICELDLTSAYGYSGMTMKAAKGFGIAFGENVKTQRRYRSFEYKATMYTLFKLNMMENLDIKAVFSNYSPLGLIYIGKHALDLVVVLADNTFRLFQFDGHFCHGDYNRPSCPSLLRYANDQTRLECEQKTMKRDEFILNWLIATNSLNSSYEVITDCCHPEYSRENLDKAFYMYHPLKDFIKSLNKLDGTIASVDFSEITFLAIVEGHATINQDYEFGPVFSRDSTKLLLTSDYYLYLKQNFGFQITSIDWIIYYKVCEDLPKVFKKFVTLRNKESANKSKSALLKSIVNYACGFFGLNTDKQAKMKARIAYKLPKRFNIFRDDVSPLESFGKEQLMLVQSYSYNKKKLKYSCNTPLVLFVQIIEYGKLQLNKSIQCLQQNLRSSAMHILYSNVDNLILSLSEDSFLDALLDQSEAGQAKFQNQWKHLCGTGPGKLKQEWCHNSQEQWQFVSPCRMFHVVLAQQQHEGHYKSTFFTGLPTVEAFKIAMAVLKKQNVKVVQEKKKAKLVGTDTHLVTYSF